MKETKICENCKEEFIRKDENSWVWENKKYCRMRCTHKFNSKKNNKKAKEERQNAKRNIY